MEVEAKFAVPDGRTLGRLERASSLAGYRLEPGERRQDRDTFLDTPDRSFLRAGHYLRRRETGAGVRLTLKQLVSSEDGVLRREELEMLVAADVPVREWPAGPLRERVEELAAGEPLDPLLTLSQERVARVVTSDAREVAELSLDVVTVAAGEREHVWREIEVETRGEGSDTDLAALAAELSRRYHLAPEPRSKFARALELTVSDAVDAEAAVAGDPHPRGRLLPADERALHERMTAGGGALARRAAALLALDDGSTQTVAGAAAGLSARRVRYWLAAYRRGGIAIYGSAATVDAAADPADPPPDAADPPPAAATGDGVRAASRKRPDVVPGDTMTAAAAKTLRFHLTKMLEHEDGTRQGDDIEELHDMRVSTRRMRMALRVFADYLDPEVMRPVRKGLRRTGRTLGAVRDLDVFRDKTQLYLDTLPAERAGELDGLLAAWAAARDRQREKLVGYLDGRAYRRFVDETTKLLDGPVERLLPPSPVLPTQRVAQVLPGILYRDMAVVWAFEGQIGGLETPLPRFHALRKACKGLRYTLEFFEDVLGPGAKPLIKRVKGLQDHLGDLQDAVVTCGVLRDYITWGTWRHDSHTLPGPVEVIVAPGEARYLAARQQEMERLILTFPEAWSTVAGGAFSKDLATVIGSI